MKNTNYKMTLRKDVKNNHNIYYDLEIGGLRFSVVNMGEQMKTAPKEVRNTVFTGWESLLIQETEDDDYEIIRADSKEELLENIYRSHKYKIDRYHLDSAISESVKRYPRFTKNNSVNVEKKGTEYNIKAKGDGNIVHKFFVEDHRATCIHDESGNISFNHASTIEEVERLVVVLIELLKIMREE